MVSCRQPPPRGSGARRRGRARDRRRRTPLPGRRRLRGAPRVGRQLAPWTRSAGCGPPRCSSTSALPGLDGIEVCRALRDVRGLDAGAVRDRARRRGRPGARAGDRGRRLPRPSRSPRASSSPGSAPCCAAPTAARRQACSRSGPLRLDPARRLVTVDERAGRADHDRVQPPGGPAARPWPRARAGPSCCRAPGVRPTTPGAAPSTCTSRSCGPSSATPARSRRCAASVTGCGPDDRRARAQLTARLVLAMTLVAAVATGATGLLARRCCGGATEDAARAPLARQAELLARLPNTELLVPAGATSRGRRAGPRARRGHARRAGARSRAGPVPGQLSDSWRPAPCPAAPRSPAARSWSRRPADARGGAVVLAAVRRLGRRRGRRAAPAHPAGAGPRTAARPGGRRRRRRPAGPAAGPDRGGRPPDGGRGARGRPSRQAGSREVGDVVQALGSLDRALAASEARQRRVPAVGLPRAAHPAHRGSRPGRGAGRRHHRPPRRSRERRADDRGASRGGWRATSPTCSRWPGSRPTTSPLAHDQVDLAALVAEARARVGRACPAGWASTCASRCHGTRSGWSGRCPRASGARRAGRQRRPGLPTRKRRWSWRSGRRHRGADACEVRDSGPGLTDGRPGARVRAGSPARPLRRHSRPAATGSASPWSTAWSPASAARRALASGRGRHRLPGHPADRATICRARGLGSTPRQGGSGSELRSVAGSGRAGLAQHPPRDSEIEFSGPARTIRMPMRGRHPGADPRDPGRGRAPLGGSAQRRHPAGDEAGRGRAHPALRVAATPGGSARSSPRTTTGCTRWPRARAHGDTTAEDAEDVIRALLDAVVDTITRPPSAPADRRGAPHEPGSGRRRRSAAERRRGRRPARPRSASACGSRRLRRCSRAAA